MAKDRKKKPERRRCIARTARGTPCQGIPLAGSARCYHHSFRVPGRPSKLTPELTERILDSILAGAYFETAAQAVGVDKTTLYRWLRRGDDAEARALEQLTDDVLFDQGADAVYNVVDPADWPYLDFRHALKSAEAFAEVDLLHVVRSARPGWQAYMTILERRWSGRWSVRQKITHEGAADLGRPKVHTIEPGDRRVELAAVLKNAGALGAAADNPNDPREDPPA